jgi:hypothetical protein
LFCTTPIFRVRQIVYSDSFSSPFEGAADG